MNFERSEEETIEALKRWWQENGKAVVAGVIIGIAGIVGVQQWYQYQQNYRQQASVLFGEVEQAINAGNAQQAADNTDTLMSEYSASPYAVLAALAMAKAKVDAADMPAAQTYLQWALTNSDTAEYEHLARQRLARVLLEQQKYVEAQALLTGIETGAYSSLYEEIRGDLAQAQGNAQQARTHYQLALNNVSNPLRRQILEMKLNDLAIAANDEVAK